MNTQLPLIVWLQKTRGHSAAGRLRRRYVAFWRRRSQQMRRLSRWGLFAAVVAIAALSVIDGAQSQRRPQRGDQTQSQPQQSQQTPAPRSETEVAEEARRRQERAEFDRKFAALNDQLAQYSFILTILAGLTFIALAALTIALGMTLRRTRIAAVAAGESADTLKKSLVMRE